MDDDYGWPEGVHKCIACGFAGTTEDKDDRYFGYRTVFGFICRKHVNLPDRIVLSVSAAASKKKDPLVEAAVKSAIKKFNRREMEREMGIFTEDIWEDIYDGRSRSKQPSPFDVAVDKSKA